MRNPLPYVLSAIAILRSDNLEELCMKQVSIEPTLKNQSNDAYNNPHFTIKMVTVPASKVTLNPNETSAFKRRK